MYLCIYVYLRLYIYYKYIYERIYVCKWGMCVSSVCMNVCMNV